MVLRDPQEESGVEVSGIRSDEALFSASIRRYPSGSVTISELQIQFSEQECDGEFRKVGELGIDSGKVIVGDKADLEKHWLEVGEDRIGVIVTPRNDRVLQILTKRFKLRTRQVNEIRFEVLDPVTTELEGEIVAVLKSYPEYAAFPPMHFYVQTNNSFDRANFLDRAWDFLPIGNGPTPQMYVGETGRGDGCYNVEAAFDGEVPKAVRINFLEEQ